MLGHKLRIYTDNENLTSKNFNIDIVIIWRLILEEYSPDIKYIMGKKNIVSYTLSIFPFNRIQETTQESTNKK